MIHRSDKRIRARSSVDRDLVLRAIPSVLFSSMDETVMVMEGIKIESIGAVFLHSRRLFAYVAL